MFARLTNKIDNAIQIVFVLGVCVPVAIVATVALSDLTNGEDYGDGCKGVGNVIMCPDSIYTPDLSFYVKF